MRTSIAAILALAAWTSPASAQDSPVGKTISGQVRVCFPQRGGSCLPPVKAQVYVSNERRVFDYSGSEAGTVTPLGRTVVENGKSRRWWLRGNTLHGEVVDQSLAISIAVRVSGGACQARYDARIVGTGERADVQVLSCRVVAGNQAY